MNKVGFVLCFILLSCVYKLTAQAPIHLVFTTEIPSEISKKNEFKIRDSIRAENLIRTLSEKANKKGYLLFNVDSVNRFENNWSIAVHIGPKLNSMILNLQKEEIQYLKRHSSLNEKIIRSIPLNSIEIQRLMSGILSSYTNYGYPFAKVELENVLMGKDSATADLVIDRGPLYSISKLLIRGDSTFHTPLLQSLIGISPKDRYCESKIRKADQRIAQINYVKTIKPSEILFRPEGVELYMYLERIPVSSVNGIIGFQPNTVTGRLDITGEANLKLTNALNRGEKIFLQWQSISKQTQNLQSSVSYPYLFKSNFGIEGKFDLYKRDSSFLELKYRPAINYFINNSTYLSAFYQGYRSNALSGANNSALTSLGNSSVNLYGIGLNALKYDYLPNPRKGYSIRMEGAIGNRVYATIDTSLNLKTLSYRGSIEQEYFIPIYKKHVLRLASQFEFAGSKAGLFENELYRFGGLQTQRGFNEDEIYASTRLTQTIEYRYLLDRNTHLFLFFDQSVYEKNSGTYLKDTPFGFGTGVSFSTSVGMFSLSYALGKQLNNPIRIADGKIHFGYIAYF